MKPIYIIIILLLLTVVISSALPTKPVVNPFTGQMQLLTNTSMLGTSALAFSTCLNTQASTWNGSYLNCINQDNFSNMPSDNSKVNKSGDNMTGSINMSIVGGKMLNFTMSAINRDSGVLLPNGDAFTNYYENNTLRSSLGVAGKQYWNVDNTGYIVYSTPGGYPGIVLLSSSYPTTPYYRQEFYMSSAGFTLRSKYFNPTQSTTNTVLIDNSGNLTVSSLADSGNAYVCVDSTGKLYRKATACDA